MQRSLRHVLAESQVAAVAIPFLLLWALDSALGSIWGLVFRLGAFLLTAIAIWDIPYVPSTPTFSDRMMLISTAYFFYIAVVSSSGAWLLSRWVYGLGPISTLIVCRSKLLRRRKHA
jgi:hypothetical protein